MVLFVCCCFFLFPILLSKDIKISSLWNVSRCNYFYHCLATLVTVALTLPKLLDVLSHVKRITCFPLLCIYLVMPASVLRGMRISSFMTTSIALLSCIQSKDWNVFSLMKIFFLHSREIMV